MCDKKKVLIISINYLCGNAIGAVRPRKIAKYLHATGKYEISVLTEANLFDDDGKVSRTSMDLSIMDIEPYIADYTLVSYPRFMMKLRELWRKVLMRTSKPHNEQVTKATSDVDEEPSQKGRRSHKRTSLFVYVPRLIDDMLFYLRAKRAIKTKKIWETDIVFSTFPNGSCHSIARYIKKKNPSVFWIADFRDPTNYDLPPVIFNNYAKSFARQKCKTADIITAAWPGIFECTDMPDVPSYVITNGFDPDDMPIIYSGKNERFTLSYVGSLNTVKQDITVLFRAIRELIDENIIDEEKICLEYAGDSSKAFLQQMSMYNLQRNLYSHGFVKREKALEIQVKSDILLVATWNAEGLVGHLPGKFLEYMMMKKPIISIVESPKSMVKEISDRYALGFCYKHTCYERDYPLLKEFIRNHYRHFIQHGEAIFEPNSNEIDNYSYVNIASSLEALFK